MKKIALGLLVGVSLYSVNALASDGTINIAGNVTANTCTPAGTAGKDISVTLPTVGTTTLAAAGATAGTTPFSISLTGCPDGVAKAQTNFEAGPTINTATGNLLNSTASGSATNVEVQLLSDTMKAINLNNNANSQVVAVSGGKATMSYYAQYIAAGGAATAGTVATSVQYTIAYP